MTEYEPLLYEESETEYKIDEPVFGSNDLTSIVLVSKYDDIIKKLDEMHRYITVIFKTGKFRSNHAISNITTDVRNTTVVINDLKKNSIILDDNVIKVIDDKLGLVSDMLSLFNHNSDNEIKMRRYESLCITAAVLILIAFICLMCLVLIVYMYVGISTKIYS